MLITHYIVLHILAHKTLRNLIDFVITWSLSHLKLQQTLIIRNIHIPSLNEIHQAIFNTSSGNVKNPNVATNQIITRSLRSV